MKSRLSPTYIIDVCNIILDALWDKFLDSRVEAQQAEALEAMANHPDIENYFSIDTEPLDTEERFH